MNIFDMPLADPGPEPPKPTEDEYKMDVRTTTVEARAAASEKRIKYASWLQQRRRYLLMQNARLIHEALDKKEVAPADAIARAVLILAVIELSEPRNDPFAGLFGGLF